MIVVTLYTYQQLSLTRGFLGHLVVSSLASGSILVECLQKEGNVDGDVYTSAANVYFPVTMTVDKWHEPGSHHHLCRIFNK